MSVHTYNNSLKVSVYPQLSSLILSMSFDYECPIVRHTSEFVDSQFISMFSYIFKLNRWGHLLFLVNSYSYHVIVYLVAIATM